MGPRRRLDGADSVAPHPETATIADSQWAAQTADHILSVIEASRSTWQMWHVRAEAQRQVRTTGVTAQRAGALVDLLVDEVLQRRSIALAAPRDGIEEPEVLRRVDGSSVYTIAGVPSIPRSESSTPNSASSPPPDDATGQLSIRRRWI